MAFNFFDEDNLLLCALVTIGMQLAFFLVAATFKFDKVTDFAGGTNFSILAILTLVGSGTYEPKQILVTVAVTIWSVRLAGFLLFRIWKLGKDDRFDGVRENFLRFLIFWIFQMIWVFTVSLPVIFINSIRKAEVSNFPQYWDYIGGILFLGGFLTETVADFQKFFYKQNEANRGHWCDSGLWRWSRHPNYFGEMIIWIGIFLISVPILQNYEFFAILSPVFTMTILLFFSGIPPLEKSAHQRYAERGDYIEYLKRTSPVIPLPPFLYKNLPWIVKLTFFFELPIYKVRNVIEGTYPEYVEPNE